MFINAGQIFIYRMIIIDKVITLLYGCHPSLVEFFF